MPISNPGAGLALAAMLGAGTAHAQPVVRDFREVADRVRPALVQVLSTAEAVRTTAGLEAQQGVAGSGVVLDAAGYIVTGAHVVRGARRVEVVLASPPGTGPGRSVLKAAGRTATAEVVGVDVETNLAVLKVEATGLSALELGDSETVRQGQLVLAFGNPPGLESALRLGLVSSPARQVRPEDPMIYIQTDAPVSAGSLGGPLVDVEGRVVGISTVVMTPSGPLPGLGLAAPSNIVRNVFEQIRRNGRVRRSHIGVRAQTLTPALAAGLGLQREWGVMLSDVTPGGPAQRAGLRIGDVVLALDGKPMENARQLEVNVYGREPGREMSIQVLRGSAEMLFRVEAVERLDDPARFSLRVDPVKDRVAELGILGLDLTEELLALLPPLRARAGVVVALAAPDARASTDPLLPGDVIYSLNGDGVSTVARIREQLAARPPGTAIVLQVERSGVLRYVTVDRE